MTAMSQEKYPLPLWPKLLLSCIVLFFFAGGTWFFHGQQKHQRQAVEENLWSIANLKSRQISEWRTERIADGMILMARRALVESIGRFLSDADDQALGEIQRRLRPIKDRYYFTDILVVDSRQRVRLSMEQDAAALAGGEGFLSAVDEAVAARMPVWTPVHVGSEHSSPHMAIAVPLFSEGADDSLVAVLVLINDAAQFLFPLLQTWPTHSDTAETLLVKKEGDDVLFLNELRHQKGTALTLRIPASRTDLPAAMAVAGRQGIVEGKDYRGVKVLAAIMPIPDSPWFLISKMDSDEAFAEWRFRSIMILVFLFSGLGLVVAVWFLIVQRNQKAYFKRLYRSEAELSQVLHKYQLLADNTLDVIWSMDTDLKFTYVNPAIRGHMGYEPEEWVGTQLGDHCSPGQYAKMTGWLDEEKKKGPGHRGIKFEGQMMKKDGTPVSLEMHVLLLFDDSGNLAGLQGTSRDITQRLKREKAVQQLQAELADARKMEAIGRLAGGVAHDYNNMLNIIIGYAELGMAGMAPEQPLHANFREITTAAERAAAITRKLLAFASRQMIAIQVIDLDRQLEDMRGALARQLGEDIELALSPAGDLWPVKMDPSQLGQILSNLCANAREAIDGAGRVTISTGNISFDAAASAAHPGAAPGDFVMLSFRDDGRGMDRETLANVFEPFFTTKPFGESAGLGLAVVYGIVKQNSGFFDVWSEPGQGTDFRLYLPRQRANAQR